jgi:hypothetical protein
VELTLTAVLLIFGIGLVMGRKHPVALASGVFLFLGVLIAGNEFGEFVRTLLSGAYGLIT